MAKENASTVRGTGTGTLEVEGADVRGIDPNETNARDIREQTRDPNAARKAIIARKNALDQAEREIDIETVPGAKALQGGFEEDGGASTDDGDAINPDSAVQPQRVVAEDAAPVVDSAASGDELVTLKVFGKQIQEPRSAVQAAGGIEARQIQLAAEERLRRGSEHLLHAEADARRAEELGQIAAEKRRAFNEQLKALNPEGSRPTATPTATPPAADSRARQPASAETPAPRGNVDRERITNAVNELYSGDPDRAAAALLDVLERVSAAPHVSLEQHLALAQAKWESGQADRDAAAANKVQIDAVNALMNDRYGETIMAKGNENLRRDCALLYNAEIADPKNRGRPRVVIADEVAKRVLGRADIADVPDADVTAAVNTRTHFKRRIPQPSSATDRVPAQEVQPAYPTKGSDVVNLLRAARGQPVVTPV